MRIAEKIEFEFKCFYLDLMKTSRENIFAHSQEIETKKEIMNELFLLSLKLDEQTEELLLWQNNLLESAYCYLQELQNLRAGDDIPKALKMWLEFLKSQQKRECQKKSDPAMESCYNVAVP